MGRDARMGQEFARRRQQSDLGKILEQAGSRLPPVLDRMNNPIEVGDIVAYDAPLIPFFQVVDIKPIMDPNAPRGAVHIVLAATFPVQLMAGRPTANVIVVGVVEAMKEATPPEGEAPAADSVPDAPVLVP